MDLRIITEEELKEILEKHKKWLETRFTDSVQGERANLRYANLYNANLENANLYNANLENANLRYANLENANLYNANLENANLENANLRYANLENANLENANLRYANLDEPERVRCGYILKEDFKAWKKCRIIGEEEVIVELLIPKGSIVFSINNKKCRTNRAKVVSITDIEGTEHYDNAYSLRDCTFIYEVGKELEIEDFNLMYNVECSTGIHFFKTRVEAVDYDD